MKYTELYNELGQGFGFLSGDEQDAMMAIATDDNMQVWAEPLGWVDACSRPHWHSASILRLNPDWKPPEPEPESNTVEFVPKHHDGMWYVWLPDVGDITLTNAPSVCGFLGFRHVNKLCSVLQFMLPGLIGGFVLIVPDAVVFDREELEAAK